MKLFTAICAALSAAAVFIYAAQHKWSTILWALTALFWQVTYLIELWLQDREP